MNADSTVRCVGVTVRTPAGASSAFAIDRNTSAARLTERAVDYFVDRDLLEPGPFRLGLVRGGTIVDLIPDIRLISEGVVEGDVLHLLTTEPQVDGLCLTRDRGWAETGPSTAARPQRNIA
jgi:hypothetical protein